MYIYINPTYMSIEGGVCPPLPGEAVHVLTISISSAHGHVKPDTLQGYLAHKKQPPPRGPP